MFLRQFFLSKPSDGLPTTLLPVAPWWREDDYPYRFGDENDFFRGRLYPLQGSCEHTSFVLEISNCNCDYKAVAVIGAGEIQPLIDLLDEANEIIHSHHCHKLPKRE